MNTIAFDLDGTLVDISHRDYQIYLNLLLKFGCTEYLDFKSYWEDRRDKRNIFEILEKSKLDKQYWQEFISLRGELMETWMYLFTDVPFAGVHQSLKELTSLYNLVLVTKRSNRENCIKQLDHLKLTQYFSHLYIIDSDKSVIFKAINNLVYVVGDTEFDIHAANRCNVNSVGVLSGIRNLERLQECSANIIYKDVLEFCQNIIDRNITIDR